MTASSDLMWERLSSRYPDIELFVLKARFDKMRHPTTDEVFERIVLEAVDWVNCAAVTTEGKFVMVRQYRFGVGDLTLETPGGMVDPGEEHGTAIKRETLEETGFGGGTWTYVGATQPNPAVFDNLCHHWVARDVELRQDPDPGAGEHIGVELLSEAEVMSAVRDGEIQHALALEVLGRTLDLWSHLR